MVPASPTDHMELREDSNEEEDFEECIDEVEEVIPPVQVVPEDQMIEEVIDLEESRDAEAPNSKHIKKSDSSEDNLVQSVEDSKIEPNEEAINEAEVSGKPSEDCTGDTTDMRP